MEDIIGLYQELQRAGAHFYHWDMDDENLQAVTIEQGGSYGVFMDFGNIHTCAEELVVVAHEGGHICTGSTHRVNSPYDLVEKHEYKANKWAVQRLIPAQMLQDAVAEGCTQIWQLAERFGVTEQFMKRAVCWYVHGTLAVEQFE